MTSNVTRTNNGKRLMAAIAVLALVACAFVAFMPTQNTEATGLTSDVAEDVTVYTSMIDGSTIDDGTSASFYVANGTTSVDATFDLDGVSGKTITVNIYAPAGAVIDVSTPESGVTVNMYVATAATPVQGENADSLVDVTYYTETATAVKTEYSTADITVVDYGFAAETKMVTDSIKVVEYKMSGEASTTYYNPSVVGAAVSSFDLLSNGTLAIPEGIEIPGNFTVNTIASAENTTPVNTLSFQTGTVAAVTEPSVVPEHQAFVTGTNVISISNSSGTLNVASASWTTGTVAVTKGSVTTGTTMTFANGSLKAIATNWVGTQSAVLYPSFTDFPGSAMVVYGDYANTDVALDNSERIHVAAGSYYSGTVTFGTNSAHVTVNPGDAEARYAVQANTDHLEIGSVVSGSGKDVTGADVIIDRATGKVTVSGAMLGNNMSISSAITIGAITNINNAAPSLIIPSTSTVSFAQGGSIVMSAGSALYLYGTVNTGSGVTTANCITLAQGAASDATIYGADYRIANAFCGSLVEEGTANAEIVFVQSNEYIDVASYDDLVAALNTSRPIRIIGTIEIRANASVSFEGKNVLFEDVANDSFEFTNGVGILVKEGATLSITDSTFDQADGVEVSITTEQYTQLNITNSLIFMVVDTDDLTDINLDNHEVTYDYSTDDVKVGFGTTLVLSSVPRGDILVYGTLNINEGTTVTIEYGKMMTVARDATVNMNGTLNVEGTVTFCEGSTGKIAGTVNVRNTQTGGAQFISAGDVEVSGTMTVSNKSATAPLQNELVAVSMPGTDKVWSGFTVTGTLNVNGGLSGIILDKGTVNINGQVEEIAAVIIFDGVSLNVSSVSGGNLVVTDYGISNEAVYDSNGTVRTNTEQSSGNIVVLDDVKGVTVSETVTAGNYTVGGTSYAYYVSDMYISGSATRVGTATSATDENITVSGVCTSVSTSKYTTRCGAVHIAEADTLTLGEDVVMGNYGYGEEVDQKLCVDGTLNVTGEGAKYLSGSKTWNGMNFTAGAIDVNGTVVIGPEAADVTSDYVLPGAVTGVRYAIQTTENNVTSTTIYYAGFDAAVTEIADAVDDTITVYGEVTVGADATIAANQVVLLNAGAVLTVNEGVTLTFANGGKISGTQASVEVKGTMTSANYREDISVGSIGADVIVTNEPARTWTSFYNALENATAPETIELSRDITLTQNTTIPEGVTVSTEYNLNTSRYTLTVDGTLDVLQGGNINIAGKPDDGNVIANGVVVMRSLGESEANQTTLAQFDGAHFTLRTGAIVSNYVTNLSYAAENVDNGTITVTGAVSAGDVVFNEAANGVLVINVVTNSGQEVNTVLSVSSMDLNGARFTVDASSRVTGSITLPYGDGTADAQIDLSRASGEFSIESSSLATATGTEYTAYIYGQTSNGSFTVAAGTVDVYHDGSVLGFTSNSTFEVASGATLVVKDATLTVANDDRTGNAYVTIAGTMELDNGVLARVQTGDSIVIEGTLDVIENANSNIVMYVPGVVNVDEDATFTVNTKMVVGSAPESLGIGGTLSGKYVINANGYILAYTGADLTNAQINWNAATGESDAETTVFYINDVEYATAYASIGNEHGINSIFGTAAGEDIELSGLNTTVPVGGYKWEDANGETSTVSDIGTPEQVYIEFDPAEVPGVVTVGAGIDLFIDGVQVSGYGPGSGTSVGPNLDLSVGTHRVSYEIRAGWDGSSVVFTFNGQTIQNGDTITITADMTSFTLSATGAINSTGTSDNGSTTGGDDGLGLTDYLLIVLVVLIVVMAIIVAIRLMRS